MLQQLVNALAQGAVYALIALGYTMVYGVLRLINFAHGEVFMVGAFVGLAALTTLGNWPLPPAALLALAILLAMLGAALLGMTIERCAYRPLRNAPRLAALITAIGVSLLLQNLGVILAGAEPRPYPAALSRDPLPWLERHAGLSVTPQQLLIVGATAVIFVLLYLIVSRTRIGKAMRAVAEDRQAAQLMGVNIDRVISFTFCLGSAIAGAGGVLYGTYCNKAEPLMGFMPGIKAFVAAVLGGIGSIPGAMLGALLMGLVETGVSSVTLHLPLLLPAPGTGSANLAAVTVLAAVSPQALCLGLLSPPATISGSTLRDAAAFAVLIAILLLRPAGLLGQSGREKV